MNESFLQECLFFTANKLSRAITKMAEEEFAHLGLTPMYGYLIRLVNGSPGISQKELSEKLAITPSTLTRFIDKLEWKQLVERQVSGKTVLVHPTEKGLELDSAIKHASKKLHLRYESILSKELSDQITNKLNLTIEQLDKRID